MKAALTELQEDVQEKDRSIDESHKIITKLKDEYSNLYKMYNSLDAYAQELLNENELNKKSMENYSRIGANLEKNQKKIEVMSEENKSLRDENNKLRLALISKNDESSKRDKALKDKEMIITDLKDRSGNWVAMIKEREQIIFENNKKIKELNEIINQKDEQLRVMVNFSKEINNENKSNVTELTKQAVKTIKIFYNTLNNSNKDSNDNCTRITFQNSNTTFSDFEPIFKEKKGSIVLEDALNGLMYIPADLKSINKEFLMDMNLKTELIKSELYSGLIRESSFVSFLEDVFAKLNFKDAESIESLCSKVIALKTNYENLLKENEELKKSNIMLMENKKEFDLYVKKLKNDIKGICDKMKEKFSGVEKGLEMQLSKCKEENKALREKCKREMDKLKAEIMILRGDKQKKEKENEMLKRAVDDKKYNEKLMGASPEVGTEQRVTYQLNNNVSPCARFSIYSSVIPGISPINQNQSFHSHHSDINDSFNEKNYRKNKKEITNLKDELSRIKSEMANLISSNADHTGSNKENLEGLLREEKEKNTQLLNEIESMRGYINSLEKKEQVPIKENSFTPNLFIKMFFDINNKLFSSSELKKFYSVYNTKTIVGVIDIFSKNCDMIKRTIYQAKFDIDTSYTDLDETLLNSRSAHMNNSYRLVNDKIIRLKKFEFDFINLSEFLKNYLIAQEIIVKLCFSGKEEVQFEPIEHLYKLFEDCLNFKIDDMHDDIIFNRKVILRFAKNQKNCLGLSLEYYG